MWSNRVREACPPPTEYFFDWEICEDRPSTRFGGKLLNLVPYEGTWPKPVIKKPEDARSKITEPDTGASRSPASKSPRKSKEIVIKDVKGKKLRTAANVLSRIRYDRGYNIDECVVGYRDRHTRKIEEKQVAEWKDDITHEEFIPEHRIEYFKRRGGVVWDRKLKIDWVFRSG